MPDMGLKPVTFATIRNAWTFLYGAFHSCKSACQATDHGADHIFTRTNQKLVIIYLKVIIGCYYCKSLSETMQLIRLRDYVTVIFLDNRMQLCKYTYLLDVHVSKKEFLRIYLEISPNGQYFKSLFVMFTKIIYANGGTISLTSTLFTLTIIP